MHDVTVVKIVEETDATRVNAYLNTGRWQLIASAPGQTEMGEPYVLYSLGWLGAVDNSDTSEFPELPVSSGWADPREQV